MEPSEIFDPVLALNAYLSAQSASGRQSFSLGEPTQLTVSRKGGQFTKKPHIGGEEFAFVRAYMGKRGSLIFVFKPRGVADYEFAEFAEADAKRSLLGFAEALAAAMNTGELRELKDAKKAAVLDAEREKLEASRAAHYPGFGSWA